MNNWLQAWRADKLQGTMGLFWLLTVVSSFFGDTILAVHVPAIGALYPFRIFLPITAILYIVWMVRRKEPLFRGVPTVEKWCYGLIAIMILYGGISLFRALEPAWTFRRLFNLCIDLCFFFLMLRLCRNKQLRHATMIVCACMLLVLCLLGTYEVFFGGIVNGKYDTQKKFDFFDQTYQYPTVFSTNTNDFCTILIFLFGLLLLHFCSPEGRQTKHVPLWIVILGIPVYFLISAANARLCLIAYYILLGGILVYYLIREKRKTWVVGILLVNMLFVQFAANYMEIVPPIQEYLQELKVYQEQLREGHPADDLKAPTLTLGKKKKRTLEEEFFDIDKKTGTKTLGTTGSGGIRVRLLIHSYECFKQSYGLGVGLGNTEISARDQAVIPESRIWSIHCFVARIIADYGIFALVPLAVIAVLLIKQGVVAVMVSIKKGIRPLTAFTILYLVTLVCYPIVSTASSDAQDIITMWLYMGMLVITANVHLLNSKVGLSQDESSNHSADF